MEELLEILKTVNPAADFENADDLIENHILDSLKIVQLVGELNDAFDITITPIDLVPENFKNAAAIYAMVKRLEEE